MKHRHISSRKDKNGKKGEKRKRGRASNRQLGNFVYCVFKKNIIKYRIKNISDVQSAEKQPF
jgi:hypothetical protein